MLRNVRSGVRGSLRFRFLLGLALVGLVLAAGSAGAGADTPAGLVAAYGFDEGTGTVAVDAGGGGHTGTLVGASRASGHDGGAVALDGDGAFVDLPALGTFYRTGFTFEAWVQKLATTKRDVAVVGSWTSAGGGPMLWVDHLAGDYQLTLGNDGLSNYLDSGAVPVAGQWQHLAATYDGTVARFYVDGVEVASRTVAVDVGSSNTWRVGAYGATPTGFFDGLVDDVRIYDRALTADEIQADMTEPVTAPSPDTTPPTAPGGLTATGGPGGVALTWTAATDDVGIVRYDVYRSTTPGFTVGAANRIAQPTGTGYTDAGLSPGTYYYKVQAEDAAGNVGPASAEASATVADVGAPTTPTGLTATGGAGQATVTWSPSTDDVAVTRYDLYRSTTSGFTPTAANRIAQPSGTTYTDAGLGAGVYYYKVAAVDAAGNASAASAEASATVRDASTAGLVAAFGMDQTSGATLVDLSGNGNNGTITGATWSTAGKYGSALSFNGSSNLVTVAGSSSLGLTTAMTLEAWIRPTTLGKQVRTVLVKEQSGGMAYDLLASTAAERPTTDVYVGGTKTLAGTSTLTLNAWTHLAATYDGTTVKLYVNGALVAQLAAAGSIATSTGALRIGGSASGGYFAGLVDEMRIYERVLSASEIQSDMTKPVSTLDLSPPAAPTGLAAALSGTTATLTWSASTDDVGVTKYDLYRSTVAGFTPSAANRIAQPTGTTYSDTGLPSGTYYYKAAAEDAAGNVSPASNEVSAVVPDTSAPSAPTGLAVGVSGRTATLTWKASTDNVGVVRYDVYRSTTSGFVPGATNRIAQPTGLTYSDTGLLSGTYYYKVAAEDAAGNVGSASGQVTATVTADTTPPTAPGGLTVSVFGDAATLTWSAATDNVGVVKYDVYRSTTSGFTPDASNRVSQPTATTFRDSGLVIGTYYYKVAAEDAGGNLGAASSQATAVVTLDTTPPTISLDSPAAGTTLAGIATLAATATDDSGAVRVQFKLDGANLGSEQTSAPYSLSWDTRGELNGPHSLTAVARDASGNTATSAAVALTIANDGVSTSGLHAAYGLDGGAGTTVPDSSGNNRTGLLVGGTWTTAGRFGGAATFTGASGDVDLPALGTFYRSAFTYEAWVYKQSSKLDVGVVGSWDGGQGGGAMIWVDHVNGHYRLALGASFGSYLDSGRSPSVGQWQHVAATYDGSTARIYIDGVEAASAPFSGSLGASNVWRIGAYGSSATGFFDGTIDNVRIYDRALSADEIRLDMASRIQPERTPPSVTATTPADGGTGANLATTVTARFSEPMLASSLTSTTLTLLDPASRAVGATVSYDPSSWTATLTPQAALQPGTTYRAVLPAGGAKDLAGNALAADVAWAFTTDALTPILVVTSWTNPFASYAGEILRAEGLDAFTAVDVSYLSSALLNAYPVVLLGEVPLTSTQVSLLSSWTTAGGNLVALRPSKLLASLLGLTDAGTTLSNAYLKVNTGTTAGAGIVGQTIQFHGTADRYTLRSASAIATLYSNATTATSNPAVTLRSVGSSGGQAAAFTYDLARSVVYTRQGNPAWAGQERDGVVGIRPDDMYYGAKTGNVQTDWVDTSRIAIPQADEQQRLLVNLITTMVRSRLPLPHFWYLPRGEKAVIVMSGDDHSPANVPGGTASIFDRFKQLSPAGCVVADWECVRGTSYIYPGNPLTNAQAAAYAADGFEVALHPSYGNCPTAPTAASLASIFDTQLDQFRAAYPSLAGPVTSRTHCVTWPDWASEAKIELARGIRMDGNYYHYPGTWIGSKPGFLNGGGFPMRFADTDGTPIDVYQQNTNMTDESGQSYPSTVNTLLDNALGPLGYYGAFGVNIHTDYPAPNANDEAIVSSAQSRGVPIVSYEQLLDWADGRNGSTIRGLSWNAGSFTFTTVVAAGATGLQTMLPVQGPTGTLRSITRSGVPVVYAVQTIKGIQYALFDAATATYQATYS